jgi:hypothetical protein
MTNKRVNPINEESAVVSLLFSVLVTVLNDEFPNLKPRMLDRLSRLRRVPRNARRLATIEEAICASRDCGRRKKRINHRPYIGY